MMHYQYLYPLFCDQSNYFVLNRSQPLWGYSKLIIEARIKSTPSIFHVIDIIKVITNQTDSK